MDKATDIPQEIHSQTAEGHSTEFCIHRYDMKDLSKRFNQINVSGYDCFTDLDNSGQTFEEIIQKCTPSTCIKFIDPKIKEVDMLPKTLPKFAAIEAVDISECGLREIPPILLQMKQLKVLKASDNHIHSLPEKWNHLDLIAIDLSENNFDEISLTINCLENLEILMMTKCNLKKFPDHLLQLKKMCCLVLDNNPLGPVNFEILQSNSLQSISLRGCFIPEMFAPQLSSLRYIDIRSNSIQVFPVDLNRKLNVLKLSGNEIDIIPEELSLLKNLTELEMSSCEIKQFPRVVLTLETLQSLDISNNFIHNIPEDILKLKLRKLCIGGNPLDEFPTFIDELSDLDEIDLSSSFLEKIPYDIDKLTKLKKLKVNDNCVEAFPESLCQKNLEKLEINENPLKRLPDSFRHALKLRCLDISSTDLQEIPPQIFHLYNLERFTMTNCALESLPDDWQKCLNISHLDLSENPLVTLPKSILQLSKLEKLILKSCCLSDFPEILLQVHGLHTLNLEQNLIAELPKNFGSMNLKTLNVRNNLLQHLPDSLSTNTRLSELNISANKLKKFPPVIFKLQNLKVLSLDDNFISVLPNNWCGLDIFSLSVKNNPLEKIDYIFDDLHYIVDLHLNNCLLTEIPTSFSALVRMSVLEFSDNNITSTIIKELPPNLISLNLDRNSLGTLPDSLQRLTKLNRLSLSHCSLKEIPTFLGSLNRLEKLYVDHNCLGYIPEELKYTMLATLFVGWNPLNSLDSLHEVRRMKFLSAIGCRLQEFPVTVLDLPKLTNLHLDWNAIHFLPKDMHHSHLMDLSMEGNTVKALPSTISNLKNLRVLRLNDMEEFPQAMLQISSLVEFHFSGCFENDIILPHSWKNATNLHKLHCRNICHFVSIRSLTKLMDLAILFTRDAIPAEVFQTKFLKKFEICSYHSTSICSLPTWQNVLLKILKIHSKKLPLLPNTLANFTRLEELCIDQTNLKIFPDELSTRLKKLQILELRENALATLPTMWGCRRLTALIVSHVTLDAWCPVLSQFPNITRLTISQCNILAFPIVLLQLSKLQELNISNNHI